MKKEGLNVLLGILIIIFLLNFIYAQENSSDNQTFTKEETSEIISSTIPSETGNILDGYISISPEKNIYYTGDEIGITDYTLSSGLANLNPFSHIIEFIKKIFNDFLVFIGITGKAVYETPSISMNYNFQEPIISKIDKYDIVTIEGLDSYDIVGAPSVPFKTIKLLLPYNKKILKVEAIPENEILMGENYNILPGQKSYPLLEREMPKFTEPDPSIYSSHETYPKEINSNYFIQSMNGHDILIMKLYPVRYVGNGGKLSYYKGIVVNIYAQEDDGRVSISSLEEENYRGLSSDVEKVQSFVDNPESIGSYSSVGEISGLSALSGESYDYLIITNNALNNSHGQYTFQNLTQWKNSRGIKTKIVVVEDINSSYSGRDLQEKIRNFLKYAYANWHIKYVLLGGDADGGNVGGESGDNIVPIRKLWTETYEVNNWDRIPSDVYYSNLDGDFDYNGNNVFGEVNDGTNGGEVDLLSEVYVGRAPVDNEIELSNFVRKTISYENALKNREAWLRNSLLVGENLGWAWASNYMEELRTGSCNWGYCTQGFSEDYSVSTLYDSSSYSWPKSELISRMNSNAISSINHLGHASSLSVMKLCNAPIYQSGPYCATSGSTDADSLTNINPIFIYSQGCYPGSFDNWNYEGMYTMSDSIAEHFVTSQNGAFAVIMNMRYGWGRSSTDGPSQRHHRRFIDAIFNKEKTHLGEANAYAKEGLIGYINENNPSDQGIMRGIYWETNLLGDPETSFYIPKKEPSIINNTGTLAIQGYLTLKILNSSGSIYSTVFQDSSKRTINPGEYLRLKNIWPQYTIRDPGNYIIYAEFKNDSGKVIQTPSGYLNFSSAGFRMRVPCIINDAYWEKFNIEERNQVKLIVKGTNCESDYINFSIYNSNSNEFVASIISKYNSTNWVAKYIPTDGDLKYYFVASTLRSSMKSNDLIVRPVPDAKIEIQTSKGKFENGENITLKAISGINNTGYVDIPGYLSIDIYSGANQLTDNGYYKRGLSIYGDNIVSIEDRYPYQIYIYNIPSKTQTKIADLERSTEDIAIYNNSIVWLARNASNYYSEVYAYNIFSGVKTKITNNLSYKYDIAIYENLVAWDDYRNGYYDIYIYNISSGVEKNITYGRNTGRSYYYPSIYKNMITFLDNYKDIYIYNISSGVLAKIGNSNNGHEPKIYGNIVTWIGYNYTTSNSDIYIYDLSSGTKKQIISNRYDKYDIQIYGSLLAWREYDDSDYPQIYLYNLSSGSERAITKDHNYHNNFAVYQSKIAYIQYTSSGNYEIFLYDLDNIYSSNVFSDANQRILQNMSFLPFSSIWNPNMNLQKNGRYSIDAYFKNNTGEVVSTFSGTLQKSWEFEIGKRQSDLSPNFYSDSIIVKENNIITAYVYNYRDDTEATISLYYQPGYCHEFKNCNNLALIDKRENVIIEKYASKMLNFSWTPDLEGDFTLVLVANSSDDINPDNNAYFSHINVLRRGADLLGYSYMRSNLVKGKEFDIFTDIYNEGSERTLDGKVSLYYQPGYCSDTAGCDNLTLIKTRSIDIDSHGSLHESFNGTIFSSGYYSFAMILNASNEVNPNNNFHFSYYKVNEPGPDPYIYFQGYNDFYDNVSNNISLYIKNSGTDGASNIQISLYEEVVDNNYNIIYNLIGTRTIDNLASQAYKIIEIPWNPKGIGRHNLIANISSDSDIDKDNNIDYKSINVLLNGTDVAITNIYLDKNNPIANLLSNIYVSILNRGKTASLINLSIYDNGVMIGNKILTEIYKGDQYRIDFPWTPLSKGAHNLSASLKLTGDLNSSNDYLDMANWVYGAINVTFNVKDSNSNKIGIYLSTDYFTNYYEYVNGEKSFILPNVSEKGTLIRLGLTKIRGNINNPDGGFLTEVYLPEKENIDIISESYNELTQNSTRYFMVSAYKLSETPHSSSYELEETLDYLLSLGIYNISDGNYGLFYCTNFSFSDKKCDSGWKEGNIWYINSYWQNIYSSLDSGGGGGGSGSSKRILRISLRGNSDVPAEAFALSESTDFDGNTTDLYSSPDVIKNLTFERSFRGKIRFKDNIVISRFKSYPDLINRYIRITDKKISVNTDELIELKNTPAEINFKNIIYRNPIILYNGQKCSSDVCSNIFYDEFQHTLRADVAHFSDFEVIEGSYCGDGVCIGESCSSCVADCGTCGGGGTGGGGGGSGGGGSAQIKCISNWSCNWGPCENKQQKFICIDTKQCIAKSTINQTKICFIEGECIDKDKDGYGVGKDCIGIDLDDNDPGINDKPFPEQPKEGKDLRIYMIITLVAIVIVIALLLIRLRLTKQKQTKDYLLNLSI